MSVVGKECYLVKQELLTSFWILMDPYGEVYPCNGLEENIWKASMGNIRDFNNFEDLWFSDRANKIRELVRACPKNCWMIGTAAPVIKKYIRHVLPWVLKNRIKVMLKKDVNINFVSPITMLEIGTMCREVGMWKDLKKDLENG